MEEQATILLVDDHEELRQLVRQLLHDAGYETLEAADARAMYAILQRQRVDLVLLDVMLPRIDGFAVCRELRGRHATLPIIMLTAKDEEFDRVLGLELGADDYITKPFSGRELTARIRAVLRRTRVDSAPTVVTTHNATTYRFGRWTFDTGRRELAQDDDVVIPLSTAEFSVLLVLVTHPGRALSRDQILDLARGRQANPFDRSIDQQVSRLRRKLDDDARNPKLIKTVWGGGYLFAGRVTQE